MAAYSGQTHRTARTLEDRLRANEVKALVATSALGMGYDKPDLAFCIHLGSPASPVAYYQQVGRAGRALDDALAVLVPAERRRADLGVLRHRRHPRRGAGRAHPRRARRRAAEPRRDRGRHRHPPRPAGDAAEDPGRRRRGGSPRPAAGSPPGSRGFSTRRSGHALRQVRAAEADLMRRVRARRGLPDAVPAAGPGRPRPSGRAGGARSAPASCRHPGPAQRRRSPPPGGSSAARTWSSSRASSGSAGLPGPQGQDRLPGAGPGARVRRRPGLERRPGEPVAGRTGRRRR